MGTASRLVSGRALVSALVSALVAASGPAGAANAATPASSSTAKRVAAFSCRPAALRAGSAVVARARGAQLKVLTTVAPITSIVANVVGDRAEVRGIVPEGTNSHTFEPKPSVAKHMANADILFVNGLKLEDPTRELGADNLSQGAQIVELGTLTLTPEQYLYDFSFPKEGGKPNPHLWTNPPMAACYARIAQSVVSNADPANAGTYKANADAYVAKVNELDRSMVAATKTVPATGRKLLTYHDAYAYFAVRYGWTVIGAIQVSSFEDPTPKEVTALIRQVKAAKVKAIFGSEVFPSPVLTQIGREAGVRYVDKLRDDDLPGAPGDAQHSYLGLMRFDFVTMVESLGGDASALLAFDPSDVVRDRAVYPQ